MKAELNLSNYATKANLKNATGVDKKTDLANLKFDVDKLDIDKFKNVTSGLRSWKSKVDKLDIVKLETTPIELSEVIKNDAIKNTKYHELVKKVSNIISNINTTDTSDLVKKVDNDTKIGEIEKKYLITIIIHILLLKNLTS